MVTIHIFHGCFTQTIEPLLQWSNHTNANEVTHNQMVKIDWNQNYNEQGVVSFLG